MKKFMSIPSILIAAWMVTNLREPFGVYEVVWILVMSVLVGGVVGFFAYLFFMAYIKKPQDR